MLKSLDVYESPQQSVRTYLLRENLHLQLDSVLEVHLDPHVGGENLHVQNKDMST